MVRPERFELSTRGLEGHCSIQLSYGRTGKRRKSGTSDRIRTRNLLVRSQSLYPVELRRYRNS